MAQQLQTDQNMSLLHQKVDSQTAHNNRNDMSLLDDVEIQLNAQKQTYSSIQQRLNNATIDITKRMNKLDQYVDFKKREVNSLHQHQDELSQSLNRLFDMIQKQKSETQTICKEIYTHITSLNATMSSLDNHRRRISQLEQVDRENDSLRERIKELNNTFNKLKKNRDNIDELCRQVSAQAPSEISIDRDFRNNNITSIENINYLRSFYNIHQKAKQDLTQIFNNIRQYQKEMTNKTDECVKQLQDLLKQKEERISQYETKFNGLEQQFLSQRTTINEIIDMQTQQLDKINKQRIRYEEGMNNLQPSFNSAIDKVISDDTYQTKIQKYKQEYSNFESTELVVNNWISSTQLKKDQIKSEFINLIETNRSIWNKYKMYFDDPGTKVINDLIDEFVINANLQEENRKLDQILDGLHKMMNALNIG